MPSKGTLTQAHLKELLYYDPETGVFTWRAPRGRAAVGSRAGTRGNGYVRVRIEGVFYAAHRLAFLYVTGAFPPDCVDHVNRDRSDNRWANLRQATRRENAGNKGIQRNNTSGHRGVSWFERSGKWRARGVSSGRQIHLGLFDSIEEAATVAQAWREESFGEYAAALTHARPAA